MNRASIAPVLIVVPLMWAVIVTTIGAYPNGPEPAVTGGFGEPTCSQSGCHTSYEVDAGKALGLGDLVISGFPETYDPGQTYAIKLAVTHTEERYAWGFQLAVRIAESGVQAGELQPADDTTQVLVENGTQYIEHTMDGTATNTFDFVWVAPSGAVGDIVVHATGNAADGDMFPEGDYIYTTSITMPSQK